MAGTAEINVAGIIISSETFSGNAYYCLGLSVDMKQKEISRRSKELNARLKIDDIPEFEGDISFLPPRRTISSVKDAIQELSHPKSRLHHHFFWFRYSEEAKRLIDSSNFEDALKSWSSMKTSKIDLFYDRKNLLLLRTLLLFKSATQKEVDDLILEWKSFLEDKDHWKAFEEHYFVEDEVGCSPQIFNEFKNEAIGVLSDIFTELKNQHRNPGFYKSFTETFQHSSDKVVSNVLEPIFERMNEVSEKLEKLDVSADGILDEDEKRAIGEYVSAIESQVVEIEKHGLKEDGTVRAVRDRAADAVRTVVLDMHNNLGEMDYAEPVLRRALAIAGTEGEKQRINRDLRVIQGVQSHVSMLKKLGELFKAENYEAANREIDALLKENASDDDLVETLRVKKQECVIHIGVKKKSQGMDLFSAGKFEESATVLNEGYRFLDNNMNIFDLNEDMIRNEILGQVRKNVDVITADNMTQVEEVRTSDVKYFQETFDSRYEGIYLILIYDCLFYGGWAGKAKQLKGQATRSAWTEKIIGWVVMIVIIGAIRACAG